jgi:arylformamidase
MTEKESATMFIDISVSLSSRTIVYEGDSQFELFRVSKAEPRNPGSWNLSRLNMSAHMGTHVDAPLHFVPNGLDVASLDLGSLNGEARVVDLRGMGKAVGAGQLKEKKIEDARRVLLKTDNCELLGRRRFSREFTHLTRDGAKYLRDLGTKLVGIDYLSVDPWAAPGQSFAFFAHHELLDQREDQVPPAIILEGIDLREVEEGEYKLWCFPLKIARGDGAPARAVLETH